MKRWTWAFLAVVVVGCSNPPATTETDTKSITGEQTKGNPTPTTGSTATAVTLADLPSDLKHAGFEYYGLGNGKPINMIMKQAGQADAAGAVEITLTEIKDGKATFEQKFTGGLTPALPNSKLLLDSKGVYSVDLGGPALDKPQMELPFDAAPGKSWKLDKPIEANGSTITKFDSKILAVEKVTVPLGTFDALKVVADVAMEGGDQKRTAKMTAWYVKGMGTVKLSMIFSAGGATQERTLLATK